MYKTQDLSIYNNNKINKINNFYVRKDVKVEIFFIMIGDPTKTTVKFTAFQVTSYIFSFIVVKLYQ